MIRRLLIPVLWCSAALAQLPTPQATPPKPDPPKGRKAPVADRDLLHVDARVADFQGRAETGLAAADFTVETDGKPQKIAGCKYVEQRPVRVALVIDDLSLSLQHLAAVKTAVRDFVFALPPEHEVAILSTSGGEGALEQFTTDRSLLGAALDRVVFNPLLVESVPKTFQVGTLGTLQAVLNGAAALPGRKAVLLFSERLRDPRAKGSPREMSLRAAANHAAVVVYAFDAAASGSQAVMLDEGVAALAENTGGKMFERGVDPAHALAQVFREQAGYYSIDITSEGLPYDFLARMPRVERLALKTGKGLMVRARNGGMGGSSDAGEVPYRAPGGELASALTDSFGSGGIRVRLTPIAGLESPAALDAILHLDANDLVLAQSLDLIYHGELQIAAELFADTSAGVQQISRGVNIRLGAAPFQEILQQGLDCKLTLAVPQPGTYFLRVAVADAHSSRVGSASQLVEVPDWSGKITMSSIVLARDLGKSAAEPPSGALQKSAPARIFPPGKPIPYSYQVYNLQRNQDKHAQIEVTSQLLREGVAIYSSQAKPIEIDMPANSKAAAAGGVIALTQQTPEGHYLMLLTVTDKLAPASSPRSATQAIDFQVKR